MIYTDDPIRDASIYYDELENEISKRAVCDVCGEHIQDEYCYRVNGCYICSNCLHDEYYVETPVMY